MAAGQAALAAIAKDLQRATRVKHAVGDLPPDTGSAVVAAVVFQSASMSDDEDGLASGYKIDATVEARFPVGRGGGSALKAIHKKALDYWEKLDAYWSRQSSTSPGGRIAHVIPAEAEFEPVEDGETIVEYSVTQELAVHVRR